MSNFLLFLWRFTEIHPAKLILKNGLFAEMEIDFSQIERIALNSNDIAEDGHTFEKLALLKTLEPHNVVIYLKEEIAIRKPYGMIKKCNAVLVQIDEKEQFKRIADERIGV